MTSWLQVMASGFDIEPARFEAYCTSTAELYVQLYPWHPMRPSLHKVLIHGAKVVKTPPLPLGLLSEEAQECRNKDIRAYRLGHARKNSRENTLGDWFLLVTSDPVICSASLQARCQRVAALRSGVPAEVSRLLSGPVPVADADG